MAFLALTSAKHAPGVTTAALALSLLWPTRTLLVEGDVAGSDLRAGYFEGQVDANHGLLELAVASRYGDLAETLWSQTVPLLQGSTDRLALPGIGDLSQTGGVAGAWEPLARHLTTLSRGQDLTVIVDAGRLGVQGGPAPLLRSADLTLLVVRSDLPDLAAARGALQVARQYGETALLVVGPGRPHPIADIQAVLETPVLATLDWDPAIAPSLLRGAWNRRVSSSSLIRSARGAVDVLSRHLEQKARLLQPSIPTQHEESFRG